MSASDFDSDILTRVAERVGDPEPVKSVDQPRGQASARATGIFSIPGISGSAKVSTNFGDVPAHLVRVRDAVRTRDGRFLPVLRIDEYKMDEEFLKRRPEARPVAVTVPGKGGRSTKVNMSPAQLVATKPSEAMGTGVRADTLSRERVAFDASLGSLSYFVFDLGEPEMIRCEGLWVRSACDFM